MKSGTVAIIGKPNVGKSTLVNAFVGTKVSIVSRHPATTRFRVHGIKTTQDYQIVFIDTPGYEESRHRLGEIMKSNVLTTIEDADIMLAVCDGSNFDSHDKEIMLVVKHSKKPTIAVINKMDKVKPPVLLLLIDRIHNEFGLEEIVPCSALTGENIEELEKTIVKLIPEGEMLFPPEYIDSLPQEYRIGEIIREKVFQQVYQEIPHSVAVEVDEIKPGDKNPQILAIFANIIVEKESQKKIIIGKNGEKLKLIGSQARHEIEMLVGKKVFLQIRVKVIEKWRDRPDISRRFGYGSI
ncbi:MAG: GTPase Era [Candidatus Omnitrophica bacterium]|nr:GTPase Era [Candidatus Omnitrophota bacterium]MCM8788988.1 GTPase Era [Candidatus Omnitrophota bacterium]